MSDGAYTFRWLLAWGIVIVVAGFVNKTRIGHVTIYYLLALSLAFLVLTQYRWFSNALSPITGATGG